ncbi:MAG: tetratricopeptide repeat protein [Deltaproteobacteria bacterium]|nr:tetratricopeptide repeat protein [Deltaproteobacteria bacterium]
MDRIRRGAVILAMGVIGPGVSLAADEPKPNQERPVTYWRHSDKSEHVVTTESDSYYRQAKELYREGPSKAPEIIALLKKAITADDANVKAHYLLGVTYFGTERFDSALRQFDRALELQESDGQTINPELRFYRARTLFELGRCEEARQILESHWAFWQDGGRLQGRYEALSPMVEKACGDSGLPQPK